MRLLAWLLVAVVAIAGCSGGSATVTVPQPTGSTEPTTEPTVSAEAATEPASKLGPGGYGFDRSDPEGGVENIMAAFATDEATATCIFEAWGDVADVPPAELTPELMTFEVCGTSIFQLMTGDPRFTGEGN